ncbi:hypothetical protein [Rhodococcus sp. OK302]|nr:hypothetical protein [Rhodococcus sp. OK302]OYD70418.1 hypothetical protein BDB13_4032 [Rhodococcus sp. OK302]
MKKIEFDGQWCWGTTARIDQEDRVLEESSIDHGFCVVVDRDVV